MELIPLLCFFIWTVHCDSGKPNSECYKQCGLKDAVATITCKENEECKCFNNGLHEDFVCTDKFVEEDDKGMLEGLQLWTECQHLAGKAITISDLKNEYFRWENKTEETNCYFLSSCNPEDMEPAHCQPGAHCTSGPSTSCDSSSATEYECDPSTWKEEDLHWICEYPVPNSPNIYGKDKIPGGTTCKTDTCRHWEWSAEGHDEQEKKAWVTCGEGGKWKTKYQDDLTLQNSENEEILPDLNDAPCHCPPLNLDANNMANPGLDLLCDLPLTENGIEYGNKCTLLCDGHFAMYIECYLGEWQNTAIYPNEIVDDSKIKC